MSRIPLRGGDEQDALSRRAKRLLRWRAGQRKRCKRSYQRRLRRVGRLATLLLQASPANAHRLNQAIAALDAGRGTAA